MHAVVRGNTTELVYSLLMTRPFQCNGTIREDVVDLVVCIGYFDTYSCQVAGVRAGGAFRNDLDIRSS